MSEFKKRLITRCVCIFLLILLLGPLTVFLKGEARFDNQWFKATHHPVGLAPDPNNEKEALVQIYAARSFSWRGAFSVHTWMAVKPKDSNKYTRYEVIGWRMYNGLSPVSISNKTAPDAQWFGAKPWLIKEIKGNKAEDIIQELPNALASYPYPNNYRAWPGPNSNTFIAHIARQIPSLRLDLPSIAIGKDYTGFNPLAKTPSGTGYQISILGILGLLIAAEEGLEINVLSLTIGFDPKDGSIKFPGIGRINY